ncbi:AAA family ATPase [Oerskovia sp. M15]
MPLVVCDTDVLATTLWHERYTGHRSPGVETLAAARRPDLYLLTGDEIPFVQDGLRDGEHIRHAMRTASARSWPGRTCRGSRSAGTGRAARPGDRRRRAAAREPRTVAAPMTQAGTDAY